MNHPEKVEVAGSGTKNRYKTILPSKNIVNLIFAVATDYQLKILHLKSVLFSNVFFYKLIYISTRLTKNTFVQKEEKF